jgi:membrane protein required for colicin V production
VAEVLSIAGWLGAALVTLWTFGDAKPYLRQYIQMQLLADILTGVGTVLVCLAYLLLTWVFPETRRPPWLENARMLPWVQAGAEYLKSLVPQEALAGAIDKAKQEAPALAPQIADPIGSLLNQNQVQPQGQPPAPAPAPAQPQPARPPALAPASPGITPTHPTPTH